MEIVQIFFRLFSAPGAPPGWRRDSGEFAGARLSLRSGASRLRSGTAERRRISLRSAQIQFRSVPLRQHPPGQPFRSTSIPPSLRFSPNQRLRPKGRFPTKRPGLRTNGPVRRMSRAKRLGLPENGFLDRIWAEMRLRDQAFWSVTGPFGRGRGRLVGIGYLLRSATKRPRHRLNLSIWSKSRY